MNINEHPIYKNIYDLCQEIEKLPASEQATKVVIMASDIEKPVARLLSLFREIKTEALNTKDAPKGLARIVRLCIDSARTLERDNQKMRDEFAMSYTKDGLGLVEENIKLREGLKVCAEALQGINEMNDNYFSREELVCDRDRELYDMLHKALAYPVVRTALKEK